MVQNYGKLILPAKYLRWI